MNDKKCIIILTYFSKCVDANINNSKGCNGFLEHYLKCMNIVDKNKGTL